MPWEPKFCKIVENPHYMEQTHKQGRRQTKSEQTNKIRAGKQNLDQTNKHGSDPDLPISPQQLSFHSPLKRLRQTGEAVKAKPRPHQKPQTTRAKPQRKEECGAGEGLTISWKAFTWKVEWSHPPGAIGLQRHVHFSQSHISLSSRNTQWNCLPGLPVKMLLRNDKNE